MGDMSEVFNPWKKYKKTKRRENLEKADSTGWSKHTEYHWYRELNGSRLDYWPSTKKWQYQGKVMNGDVEQFIRKRVE